MVPCCHSGVDGPPVHRPAAKIATGLRLDSPWSWEASAMQAWLTSLPLFWRVFGINAAVLVLAFLGFALLIVRKPSEGVTCTIPSDAIRRVRNGVQAAEDQIPRVGGGLADVDRFAANLRAIDIAGAPQDLRVALSNYIAAVEKHGEAWRQGGYNAVTADKVAEAQTEFRRVLVKPRGLF